MAHPQEGGAIDLACRPVLRRRAQTSDFRLLLAMPILQHPHAFDGDHAFVHRFVEEGEQGGDFVGGIHDFDDDRQIGRKVEQPARVDA